jgi:flagellar basal body rod protein FlgG
MHAFGGVAAVMLLAGVGILAWLALEKLLMNESIGGRPLLLLGALLVLIGTQLLAVGLLGELLTRIYHERLADLPLAIPANAKGVTISADGVVSVTQANSAAVVNVGTINLVGFMNPAGLEPKGQNLYSESASSGAPVAGAAGTNGLGNVMQGYVEGSNVNVVQELVAMIQTQRSYEMNSKAIQTADQMLQKLGQV